MFRAKVSNESVKLSKKGEDPLPYVRFDMELWAVADDKEVLMLCRSLGWRVINGYISPPKSHTARGYMATHFWHPLMLAHLWEVVKPVYDGLQAKHKELPDLKDVEIAVKEGCIPAKFLKEAAAARQ